MGLAHPIPVKRESLNLGAQFEKSSPRNIHKEKRMAVKNSTQNWSAGEIVKVGWLKLRILGMRSVVDGLPDIYTLENLKGDKTYEFTPHHGLVRIY
jgi:hypothetical protein